MSLFVIGLSRLSSKESKTTMLIGYMGIARLMKHVQKVEDQLRDKEEFKNKRCKTSGNECEQQKSNGNRSFFPTEVERNYSIVCKCTCTKEPPMCVQY